MKQMDGALGSIIMSQCDTIDEEVRQMRVQCLVCGTAEQLPAWDSFACLAARRPEIARWYVCGACASHCRQSDWFKGPWDTSGGYENQEERDW